MSSNNNNSDAATNNVMGNIRMGQLLDEGDHKRCSEGNKAALLSEALAHLRSLTKELHENDWMHQTPPQSNVNNGMKQNR